MSTLFRKPPAATPISQVPTDPAAKPQPSIIDLRSASMIVKGSMASIELKDGQLHIKRWLQGTVTVAIDEVSGVNLVEPVLGFPGYLHIATFSNPAPPNSRFSNHPQVLGFKTEHDVAVKGLFEAVRAYLAANPAQARHPEGEAAAEGAMKLDVLNQKTRTVYDEQVGDHDVRFIIMGVAGQAIVALTNRLVVVKAGYMAGATGGGRATSFRYADVVGIEINTGWTTAVIEIVTPGHTGTHEHDFWATGKDRNPWKLSHTLPLGKEQLESQKHYVDDIRKLIDEAKLAAALPAQTRTRDVASQLQDLAELRAKGILSDDEFAQAKRKVLDSE